MKYNDLLHLNATKEAVKLIDTHLKSNQYSEQEFVTLSCKKSSILVKIGEVEEGISTALALRNKNYSKDLYQIIDNTLIEEFLYLNDFDNALKIINDYKDLLENYNQEDYYRYLIKLYQKQGDEINLKKNILIMLDTDLDDKEYYEYLKILLKMYYDSLDYPNFLKYKDVFLALATKLNYFDDRYLVLYENLEFLYNNANFMEALNGLKIFDDLEYNINKIIPLKAKLLKMKTYMALNDFRKASILETEFEVDFVESKNDELILDFYNTSLSLYNTLGNKVSIESYEQKIAKLLERINQKEVKNIEKDNVQKVVINLPNKAKEDVKAEIEKPNLASNFVSSNYLELLNSIYEGIKESRNFSNIKDIIKGSYEKLTKKMHVERAIVLYYSSYVKTFELKDRHAYERNYTLEDTFDTFFEHVMATGEELIIPNSSSSSEAYDFITKKNIENKTIYVVPFLHLNKTIGAVAYYLHDYEELTKDLNYEMLKNLSNMFNFIINIYLDNRQKFNQLSDYQFIFDNAKFGLKQFDTSQFYLNTTSQTILDASEILTLDEYLQILDSSYQVKYKAFMENILNISNKEIIYKTLNDKVIRETFFVKQINKKNIIYSLIFDETLNYEKEVLVFDKINYFGKDKFPTYNLFKTDFEKYIKHSKLTFIKIGITNIDYFNNLYGASFKKQLNYALGLAIKNCIDKPFYIYNENEYLIIYDMTNDIRTINNFINKLNSDVSEYLLNLNSKLNVILNLASIRIPVDIKNLELSTIMNSLDKTYSLALNSNNHIGKYNAEEVKNSILEESITSYIAESIDQNNIMITYSQVLNTQSLKVSMFKGRINLKGYDIEDEKIKRIIEIKNQAKELDKWFINNIFKEAKKIISKTAKNLTFYIKLFSNSFDYANVSTIINSVDKLPNLTLLIETDNYDNIKKEYLEKMLSKGILFVGNDVETLLSKNIKYLSLKTSIISDDKLMALQKMTSEIGASIIANDMDNKENLVRLNRLKIGYGSGNLVNQELSLLDILNAYSKK